MTGLLYQPPNDLIPTRESLLSRIRDPEADESWKEFFNTYWKLIYNAARRAGLTDAEAQEVVQETMIGVARKIPEYRYDPSVCSFKTWLLNLTIWRIRDQFRKRESHQALTDDVHDEKTLAAFWDADWESNLIDAAIKRVKKRIRPSNYQAFDFCELQQKGPAETARVLGVSTARIYLVCHRVARAVRREIKKLKRQQGEEE